MRDVTITYLELPLEGRADAAPTVLLPGTAPALAAPRFPAAYALRRCPRAQPELNRFLYTAVGGPWYWTDKLEWTWAQWEALLGQPGYETWILTEGGSIAGFFELEPREGGAVVDLALFGLLPAYTGRGLGRPLLEAAIARAGALGARTCTVNTCTLDHAAALPNYLARGFRVVRTAVTQKDVPVEPPGPWPGSGVLRGR